MKYTMVQDEQKERLEKSIQFNENERIFSDWSEDEKKETSMYKISDGVGKYHGILALVETKKYVDKTGEYQEERSIKEISTSSEIRFLQTDESPWYPCDMDISNCIDYDEDSVEYELVRINIRDAVIHLVRRACRRVDNGDAVSFDFEDGKITVELPLYLVNRIYHNKCEDKRRVHDYINDELSSKMALDEETIKKCLDSAFEVKDDTILVETLIDFEHDEAIGSLEDWMIRFVELERNSILKNNPLVAAVKAVKDKKDYDTQKEIADELGSNEGNISRKIRELEEWEERLEWSKNNW
jgi:hypothetical protein